MARCCFFSLHYQAVIDFRSNVVRNHNITKDDWFSLTNETWRVEQPQPGWKKRTPQNTGRTNLVGSVGMRGEECWREGPRATRRVGGAIDNQVAA